MKKGYDKAYLKDILIKSYNELGRLPMRTEIIHYPAIENKLGNGSWNEALKNVFGDIHKRKTMIFPDNWNNYTDEQLNELFIEDYNRLKPKSLREFEACRGFRPSIRYYNDRFNLSYNCIKLLLELDVKNPQQKHIKQVERLKKKMIINSNSH